LSVGSSEEAFKGLLRLRRSEANDSSTLESGAVREIVAEDILDKTRAAAIKSGLSPPNDPAFAAAQDFLKS